MTYKPDQFAIKTDNNCHPDLQDMEFVFEKIGRGASFDNSRYVILPGFCDVHVHFREPGFSYKETIKSGTAAALHGGYTDVCTMPNLLPVPDCKKNLDVQTEIIKRDALINVYPYGAITKDQKGEKLSDMADMANDVIAFSDDGKGVQSDDIMQKAMEEAKRLSKLIVAHCEVNSLLCGGYIHKGRYAESHGHRGIVSESEWRQVERDISIAKKTGCKYHVCHISCSESVELIRRAKTEGVDVSCETSPHYLTLCEDDLCEDGRFKMNPPLRSKEDKEALIRGICDGTIDMIATDHAPHSKEEKSRGLCDSAFGIVGLETAFPVLYTSLVKTGVITLEKLVCLLAKNPRERFSIPQGSDFSVWDMQCEYKIDPENFLSLGRVTPYEGKTVFGKNIMTVVNGKVYEF